MEKAAERCGFSPNYAALTVDDVYEIAKSIGTEIEKLIDGFGKDSVLGLVPKTVKVLELLESFASRNQAIQAKEEELLRTFESLQVQKSSKRAARESDEGGDRADTRLQQQEEQWRRRSKELQLQVQQLQEEREALQSRLKGSHAQEDRVQRQEREVMLKLKQVVDKQRDELRAKVQEISGVSKEVEALQEQLDRFMKMNAELRHKQSVLQAQLKSSVERKADMEADLKEKSRNIQRLQERLDDRGPSSPRQTSQDSRTQADQQKDADQPCFTKKEVRDILFERNELKANLFLVQEELNYYQREILSEERCPGFLLEAVRAAIKKQRTLIKAKMLGIPANECSSDEEERNSEQTETDGGRPEESRIQKLFGFLTWSGSSAGTRSPTHMTSSASAWEILEDSEASGEEERA
ncbi:rab-interacting lysosomal protein [Genypterus blacodes]|uniref:rab-interacting lysosomal protein n=1 Tax=Genypterus blacodes TaxID=154954 RepID=UPI003F7586B4